MANHNQNDADREYKQNLMTNIQWIASGYASNTISLTASFIHPYFLQSDVFDYFYIDLHRLKDTASKKKTFHIDYVFIKKFINICDV